MIKDALIEIFGNDRVSDSPSLLETYARGNSVFTSEPPQFVVYPTETSEVQAVIKLANKRKIAITPKSSGVSFNGASLPEKGGIVVDLKRMNRVLEIDTLDRKAKVEPGVTWRQLQAELKKENLMVSGPLLPHPDQSVLTSTLQREPMVIPKSEYNEVLMTGEVVLGTGELFWTGTAIAKGMLGQTNPEAFLLGTRIFHGQQGTLGIFTWANIKLETIPILNKVYFIPLDSIEKIFDPVRRIQRLTMGSECFALNNVSLATILAQATDKPFEDLKRSLPPYTIIQVLTGLKRRPEEQVAYEEEALLDLADELKFHPTQTLDGIDNADEVIIDLLRGPWPKDPYWKNYPYQSSLRISFHTPLQKARDYIEKLNQLSDECGYATDNIGLYAQPIERARMGYLEFNLPFDSRDKAETEKMITLHDMAGKAILDMGGIITNPDGIWSDQVFKKAESYLPLMEAVKQTFDPNRIMNPGKLCF